MAQALEHVLVHDAMHHGILSCSADAPFAEVAGIMARQRVHAIAITDPDGGRPIGLVSDLDVLAAMSGDDQTTAIQAAATEPLTVSADERLHRAAQLMNEHGVSHLVVLDAAGGFPIGILSTLDVVAAYSGGLDS